MPRLALAFALAAATLSPIAALAHAQEGVAVGLLDGLLHPVLGVDHLVAMVAVGLWGAQLGQPLLVALPIAFPLMMAVGAVGGALGLPLPAPEFGVSASAIALGLFVWRGWRAPVWAAVGAVAVFALFHGYAHGVSAGTSHDPLAFGVGFTMATGLLHLVGIGVGALAGVPAFGERGAQAVRGCGAGVAAVGAAYMALNLGAGA